MNRNEEASARRALLELFISDLEEASKQSGAPILRRASGDTSALVIDGLRRVLDGEDDPFRIAPPRGIKPRMSRKHRQFLAAVVGRLAGEIGVEDAFVKAGHLFNVGKEAARDAYYAEKAWIEAAPPEWWKAKIDRLLGGARVSDITP